MSDGDICMLFGFMAAAGAGAYWHGLGQYELKRAIEQTPTSKAIAVAPGIAEVSGKAKRYKAVFASPLNGQECVYYRTHVYAWSGSGKHRRRSHVATFESPDPIIIEDDTGEVLVKPQGAKGGSTTKDMLEQDTRTSETPGRGAIASMLLGEKKHGENDRVYNMLAQRLPKYANYTDTINVEETFVREGDPLYCIGTASANEGPVGEPAMLVKYDASRKVFCIVDGDEKKAASRVSFEAILSSWGGPLLFGTGLFLLFVRFNALNLFTFALTAFATLALYVWLVLSGILWLYNGLVALRAGVDRARGNIDAMLQKRADLIPQLVELTRAYAAHEAGLFEAISVARSDAATRASASFVALQEKYPDLKANENFLSLQKTLAKLEEHIAASRIYYNDSVELYNAKIGKIPYNLIAAAANMRPIPYYEFKA